MTRKPKPTDLIDQAPPNDAAAENAILACILLSPHRFADVAAAVVPNDFYHKPARTIFTSMLRLHSATKPIDITLLVGDLRDAGEYDVDDGICAATLSNLFRLFAMVCYLPHYIARLKEMSQRRSDLERGISLVQSAYVIDGRPKTRRRIAV